ncbi:MAG: hypothetical protein R3A78_09205 [Polyangiales bacterium]
MEFIRKYLLLSALGAALALVGAGCDDGNDGDKDAAVQEDGGDVDSGNTEDGGDVDAGETDGGDAG